MTQLFKLLNKYRPESRAQKKERLRALAEKKVKGDDSSASHKKPVIVKYGIHHITSLVEQKKAQLVVIAHDVDPIEVRTRTHTHTHTLNPLLSCGLTDCSMVARSLSQNGRSVLYSEREGKVREIRF